MGGGTLFSKSVQLANSLVVACPISSLTKGLFGSTPLPKQPHHSTTYSPFYLSIVWLHTTSGRMCKLMAQLLSAKLVAQHSPIESLPHFHVGPICQVVLLPREGGAAGMPSPACGCPTARLALATTTPATVPSAIATSAGCLTATSLLV